MLIRPTWWLRGVFAPDGGTGGGGASAPAAGAAAPAGGASQAGAAPASAVGGAGSGSAPPAAGGASAPAAGTPPASFADSLPADLRERATFKDIKSLDALARSFDSAQRMLGADKATLVQLPTTDDPEAWKGVWEKLGRPEAPDKYGFKAPEGVQVDTKLQEGFASRAHELGLNTKQATALYDWYNSQAGAAMQAQTAAQEASKARVVETLKGEWGAAFDQNMGLAQLALSHYGSPEVRAELDASGLGNNANLIRLFAKLGRGLSEDGLIGKGGAGGGAGILAPTEARQQIASLQGDSVFMKSYLSKSEPGHKDAVAKMQGLYEQAYPSA